MLRHAMLSVLMVTALADPTAAETIGPRGQSDRLELSTFELTVLDPSFQTLVIAAAESDWRESRGADMWWISSEDMAAQVMVFPTLRFPGNAEPNCCSTFTLGDTEFWIKSPFSKQRDNHTSGDAVGIGDGVSADTSFNRSPPLDVPGAPGSPVLSTIVSLSDAPADPNRAASADVSEQQAIGDFAATQVPEPGSLMLFGIALSAVGRRLRAQRLSRAFHRIE
jgi:hypothetical protein